MWRGVYWINTRPSGFDSGEPDVSSMDYVAEPSGPAEPIQCLGCGTTIPENQARCPQCGWSYRVSRAGE